MKPAPPDLLGPRSANLKHSRGYAAAPGSGPPGETCGSCAFIGSGRFKKCRIGQITSGAATDILVSAPACRLWTRVGALLCEGCVHYCPWNGEGMGCSAPGVERLLGREPPPCRGIYFREPKPVALPIGDAHP